MTKINVSKFEVFDGKAGGYIQSSSFASLECIESINGRIIENTAIEIDESELDGNGVYHLPNVNV